MPTRSASKAEPAQILTKPRLRRPAAAAKLGKPPSECADRPKNPRTIETHMSAGGLAPVALDSRRPIGYR
jgi:hypothetical protein